MLFQFTEYFPISSLYSASIPFVGSSIRRILGLSRSTFASASLCCSPPLRSYGWRSSSPSSLVRLTIPSIAFSFFYMNLIFRRKFFFFFLPITEYRSSRTVFLRKMLCGFCGMTPRHPQYSSRSLKERISRPSSRILPL